MEFSSIAQGLFSACTIYYLYIVYIEVLNESKKREVLAHTVESLMQSSKNESIDTVVDDLVKHLSIINGLKNDIVKLEDSHTETLNLVDRLRSTNDNHLHAISDEVAQRLETLGNDVNQSLSSLAYAINKRIEPLESLTTTLDKSLAPLGSLSENIDHRLISMANTIDELIATLTSNMNQRITPLESVSANVEKRVGTLDTKLATLESLPKTVNDNLLSMSKMTDVLINQRIATLTSTVDQRLATLSTTIDGIPSLLTTHVELDNKFTPLVTLQKNVYQAWLGKGSTEAGTLSITIIRKKFTTDAENKEWTSWDGSDDLSSHNRNTYISTSSNDWQVIDTTKATKRYYKDDWESGIDITLTITFTNGPLTRDDCHNIQQKLVADNTIEWKRSLVPA